MHAYLIKTSPIIDASAASAKDDCDDDLDATSAFPLLPPSQVREELQIA